MAMNKDFKTIDEQITILEFKGLKIENKEYAKQVLLRENYFFLNGYRHLFFFHVRNTPSFAQLI